LKADSRLSVLVLLLIGAALRLPMLGHAVRFHPDETLYATYARRMSVHGDFLLNDVPLDKPPLGIGLTALSFSLLGVSEFSARVPTCLINLLQLAVVYALSRRLFGRTAALFTLLLMVLAPMDLQFAATVFHDPALSLSVLLVGLFAVTDRWRVVGISAAAALWIKQSAVQFVPLTLALGMISLLYALPPNHLRRAFLHRTRRFVIPVLIGAVILALWSVARAYPADFWTLGVLNPGLLRFIRADEVLPRLGSWLTLLGMGGPLLIFAPIPAIVALRARPSREHWYAVVLSIGLLATLLAYWLLAFNTYDRYVYTLLPLLLMLAGRGAELLLSGLKRRPRLVTTAVVVAIILTLPFTIIAEQNQLPIGGDKGTYTGVDDLARVINELPRGSVVYDHWLDQELRFYMGDLPPVAIAWLPTPEWLKREVCAEPSHPIRYFVAPAGVAARWLAALRNDDVSALPPVQNGKFELYQLRCVD